MNRLLSTLAVAFVVAATLARAEEPTHTKDSLATVKENVKSGKAVIVDVREQEEWDAGHVKGAIHAPKSKLTVEAEMAELIKKLDKGKTLYTHCGAGKRALQCGEILKKQGFDVRPLKPGYKQLIDAGFENEAK